MHKAAAGWFSVEIVGNNVRLVHVIVRACLPQNGIARKARIGMNHVRSSGAEKSTEKQFNSQNKVNVS